MSFDLLALCLFLAVELSKGCATNCEREKAKGFLETASDLISRAQSSLSLEDCSCSTISCEYPSDCAEVLHCGHNTSGIYTVWPRSRIFPDNSPLDVYCDMTSEGGGWTVFQRRGDYGRAKDYFFQDWESYKNGFGNLEKDFWLGNEKISALTNQKRYSIRFDLVSVEGEHQYALYDSFWIEDEYNNYTLHVSGYTGTAGDSITRQNKMQFTTKDRDNDIWDKNCAVEFKGAWWYSNCHSSNLNGQYLKGPHESYADGVEWSSWKGQRYSLLTTEMKIRPEKFKLQNSLPESTVDVQPV